MGKQSSKKRRKKLARPPKSRKRTERLDALPPLVEPGEPDFALPGLGPREDDLPDSADFGTKPPAGIDPSLQQSKRYRNFMRHCAAIEAELPTACGGFGVGDVKDPKLRAWLIRYCLSKETGRIYSWQEAKLEAMGFDWRRPRRGEKRGTKPVQSKGVTRAKAAKKTKKVKAVKKLKGVKKEKAPAHPGGERAWEKFEAFRSALAASPEPPLRALMLDDKVPFDWFLRQLAAFRAKTLKPGQLAKLQETGLPLEALAETPRLKTWRNQFAAYAKRTAARAEPPQPVGEKERDRIERWLCRQEAERRAGRLAEWKIELLETQGLDWGRLSPPLRQKAKKEARWREKLETYLKLESSHGRPLPQALVRKHGLMPWLSRMREQYRKGTLSRDLVAEFAERGFVFDPVERRAQAYDRRWEAMFARLLAFRERFGHARVPASFSVDPSLGDWMRQQRERMANGKLPDDKRRRLEAVGVPPHDRDEASKRPAQHVSAWLKAYESLKSILERDFGGQVPEILSRLPGKYLNWLGRQHRQEKRGRLETWQREALKAVGYDSKRTHVQRKQVRSELQAQKAQAQFEAQVQKIREFVNEHGHGQIPRSHPDSVLVNFISRVRTAANRGKLPREQVEALREAGLSFNPKLEPSPAWMRHYQRLKAFHALHGHSNVPRHYPPDQPLAEYCAQERQRGRKGKLLARQIELLDALGFHWVGGRPKPKDKDKRA